MGAFPLSLIARGRMSRKHFHDSHRMEANKTPCNATEEFESSQQSQPTAPVEQVETTQYRRGPRRLAPFGWP